MLHSYLLPHGPRRLSRARRRLDVDALDEFRDAFVVVFVIFLRRENVDPCSNRRVRFLSESDGIS